MSLVFLSNCSYKKSVSKLLRFDSLITQNTMQLNLEHDTGIGAEPKKLQFGWSNFEFVV